MLDFVLAFLSSPGGALVTSAAGTILTFVWHRLRGDKQDSFTDAIRGVGKTVVDSLVKSGFMTAEHLTPLATKLLTDGVRALGIDPDNSIVKPILAATIQHAIGDALAEIARLTDQAKVDAANLAIIQANATDVAVMFAKAQAEGLARVAGMKDLVESAPVTTKASQP